MGQFNPYQTPQTDVTAPLASGLDQTGPFEAKGRFGRLSYIAWYFALTLAAYAVMFVVAIIFGLGAGVMGTSSPDAGGAIAITLGILYMVFGLALLVVNVIFFIRRLHDIDLSGWWALLMLIPLVNVIFLLIAWLKRGTPGANRFGPPRETRSWEKVVGIIASVLIVLSFVVLIAAAVVVALNPDLQQQLQQMQQLQQTP